MRIQQVHKFYEVRSFFAITPCCKELSGIQMQLQIPVLPRAGLADRCFGAESVDAPSAASVVSSMCQHFIGL